MVGIPKDLVLPFALAMLTFLSGKALYPLLFNKHIASIFLASVSHFIWSTLPYVYLYWKLLSLSPMPWLRRKWQVGTVRPLPCCTSFLCGPLLFGPAVFSLYAHIWKNRYLFMSCFVRLKMHTRLLPCSFAVSSFY